MRACKFVLLSLLALSVFSCKANIADDPAVSDNLFNINDYRSPKEEYLSTRTLRDELVEDVIFGQYRADDHYIDQALVTLVLGESADLSTPVYKKDQQTLLTYTLPSYKVDKTFQTIELDSEYTEDIIVKSFDFNIEGKTGFVVVSNDDRLGIILSFYRDSEINRNEIKRAVIKKVNAQIDTIKREWSTITSGDVHSVIERGWGVSQDYITKGKFADAFCTEKSSTSRAMARIPRNMSDYMCYERFREQIVDDEDEWALACHEFIETLCRYFAGYDPRKNNNLSFSIPYDYNNPESPYQSYLDEIFKKADGELRKLADKINKSSSISAEYAPYKGKLVNNGKLPALYTSIDPLIMNAHLSLGKRPRIEYSYYNYETGTKNTIEDVVLYISKLSSREIMDPLTNRIFNHLLFLLRGGFMDEFFNKTVIPLYHFNKYVFKIQGETLNGWQVISNEVKKRYSIDLTEFEDGEYFGFNNGVSPFLEKDFELKFAGITSLIDDRDTYARLVEDGMSDEQIYYEFGRQLQDEITGSNYYDTVTFLYIPSYKKYVSGLAVSVKETKKKVFGIFKKNPKYTYESKFYVRSYDGNSKLAPAEDPVPLSAAYLHRITPKSRTSRESYKPSVTQLPLKAKDGRVLIDVWKDGKFELVEEDVFKQRMKQAEVGKDASANKNDAGSSNTSDKGANEVGKDASANKNNAGSSNTSNKGANSGANASKTKSTNTEPYIILTPPKKKSGKPRITF